MNLSLSRCFSWDQERKKLGEKNKIRGKNESSKVIWAASTLSGNSIKQIQEMAKENTVMTKKKKSTMYSKLLSKLTWLLHFIGVKILRRVKHNLHSADSHEDYKHNLDFTLTWISCINNLNFSPCEDAANINLSTGCWKYFFFFSFYFSILPTWDRTREQTKLHSLNTYS